MKGVIVNHQTNLKIDQENIAEILAKKQFSSKDEEFVSKKLLDELIGDNHWEH
jgi:hypothetical protein